MVDFFKLPFPKARKYLRRIYLSLDFLKDHNLDPMKLDVKAIYTPTGLAPVLLVNNTLKINEYIVFGSTEQGDIEALEDKKPKGTPPPNSMIIGYKHFDRWKFKDGVQIGDFRNEGIPKNVIRLQWMIQREVLGFWKFWTLRLLRKI